MACCTARKGSRTLKLVLTIHMALLTKLPIMVARRTDLRPNLSLAAPILGEIF